MRSDMIFLKLLLLAAPIFGGAALIERQTKAPVSSTTWNNIVRYTKFTFASPYQPCPKPPLGAVVVQYINESSTNTQATIFRDDKAKELILAIPGTKQDQDYLTDVLIVQVPFISTGISNCTGCGVHLGFLSAWNSISKQATQTLKTSLSKHPDYSVLVTGHSLGGAIASLGAASLKGQKLPVKAAYTYGQPRTGNQAFANYIDKIFGASQTAAGSFFRVTHADDPIPQIIPQFIGYRHHRTEYWETDSPQKTQSQALTYRCFGEEPADCNLSVVPPGNATAHVVYSNIDVDHNNLCG